MRITNHAKNNTYYHAEHDCVIGGTITVSEYELVNGLLYLENQHYHADNNSDTCARDALRGLFNRYKVAQLTELARKNKHTGVCIGVTPTIMLAGYLNTPSDPDRKIGHTMPKNYKQQNYKIVIK